MRAGAALPALGEGARAGTAKRAACAGATTGRRRGRSRRLTASDRAAAVAPRPAYRIDGASASREAFYAIACDPPRSVVVEACAGAGKTWMLVSRILRALLDGAEPHEILAITFTRKAAGEMRDAPATSGCALSPTGRATTSAASTSCARAGSTPRARATLAPRLGGLHEQRAAAGRPVEIRTFHAWFSQLLRGAPLELLAELGLQPTWSWSTTWPITGPRSSGASTRGAGRRRAARRLPRR